MLLFPRRKTSLEFVFKFCSWKYIYISNYKGFKGISHGKTKKIAGFILSVARKFLKNQNSN